MSASEKMEDCKARTAIVEALLAADRVPIQPLIDLIVLYALPFRSRVSTVAGSSDAAVFNLPVAVRMYRVPAPARARKGEANDTGATGDVATIFVADSCEHHFLEIRLAADGNADPPTPIVGTKGQSGFRCAHALNDSRFEYPSAIAIDPLNPNRLYVCDWYSIRLFDRTPGHGSSGVVTLIAGRGVGSYVDGAGDAARFNQIGDCTCTGDGKTLIVCDTSNSLIRSVALDTRLVTTIVGNFIRANVREVGTKASIFSPVAATFAAPAAAVQPTATPNAAAAVDESVMFIACNLAIARFNRRTGDVSFMALPAPPITPARVDESVRAAGHAPAPLSLNPAGLACAPNGWLLFTCSNSSSLYALNPYAATAAATNKDGACAIELVAGSGRHSEHDGSALTEAGFRALMGVCVAPELQSALIADAGNRAVRSVTLPPHYFMPRQQCS